MVPSLNNTTDTEELTIILSDLAQLSNSTKANLDVNSSRGVKDIVRDKKGIFIALICAAVLLLTIGVVVVIWKFCFRKKRDQHQQVKKAEDIKVLWYSQWIKVEIKGERGGQQPSLWTLLQQLWGQG